MASKLKKYEALKTPRIVWATQDFSSYDNNKPNIYVSKNVSSEVGKHLKYQNVEIDGSIQDLRAFFNESDQKSFLLMTNGSLIVKLRISIEDKSGQEVVRNDDETYDNLNNIEAFNGVPSSFR